MATELFQRRADNLGEGIRMAFVVGWTGEGRGWAQYIGLLLEVSVICMALEVSVYLNVAKLCFSKFE